MSYTRPPAIPPTVTQETGPMAGTLKKHPAYGTLRFSRIQGESGKLFGSEISHQSFIRLEVSPAEEHWSLSQSWIHSRAKTFVEIDMSAAQFAELISSLNVGNGVPCTMRYIEGLGTLPEIVDTDTFHQQIKDDLSKEAKDAFGDAEKLIASLRDTLVKSKLPKIQQKQILDIASRLESAVKSSMPFILDQYQEGAEKIAAKAKAELDAFATHVVNALGKKALAALNEGGEGGKAVEIAR